MIKVGSLVRKAGRYSAPEIDEWLGIGVVTHILNHAIPAAAVYWLEHGLNQSGYYIRDLKVVEGEDDK